MTGPRIITTHADTTDKPETWMVEARCRDVDPAIFFPKESVVADRAQPICADCPARVECLNFALDHHIRYGVWGGTTERERQRLRMYRRTARSRAR